MEPSWIKDAVIYQIYPQSFQDTNADGIGDFQGIIKRLDYIASLGVNAIWMSPCFDSPFGDAGYDVADFCKVAPRYGTKDDLVALFEKAHAKGIKVILDLVAGHTSIEHSWFVDSAKGPDAEFADRYIWMNRDFDPKDGPTEKNFRHNFFWFQPALNYGFANPKEPWQDPIDAPGPQKTRQALYDIMAYWMDLGADGFRVDMASSLVKEDEGFKETTKLWQDIRAWFNEKYPENILIAEWSNPAESVPAGFHLDFLMHFNMNAYRSLFFNETGAMAYDGGECYFDKKGLGSPWIFMDGYKEQLEAVEGKGYISIPSANHDFQHLRCGSRDWEGLPVCWVFFMTQKGPVTIYMGDEIGMRYVPGTPNKEGALIERVSAENAGDPIRVERAGTRTPFQWDSSKNAGFSEGDENDLYLPLDPDAKRPTVESQEADPDGIIHFVRKLLNLRKAHPALAHEGDYIFRNPKDTNYPMLIERALNGKRYLIALNAKGEDLEAEIEESARQSEDVLAEGVSLTLGEGKAKFALKAFGYGIFQIS